MAKHPRSASPACPGRRRLASAAFATFPRCRPLLADLAAHRIGDILVPGGYHDHPGDDFGQLDVRGADRSCVAGTPEVQDGMNRWVQVYSDAGHGCLNVGTYICIRISA